MDKRNHPPAVLKNAVKIYCTILNAFHFTRGKADIQPILCQDKAASLQQLTFTVPTTPALATLCTILSIDEEVIVGLPCSIVTRFTVLKQAAAWQWKNTREKWRGKQKI